MKRSQPETPTNTPLRVATTGKQRSRNIRSAAAWISWKRLGALPRALTSASAWSTVTTERVDRVSSVSDLRQLLGGAPQRVGEPPCTVRCELGAAIEVHSEVGPLFVSYTSMPTPTLPPNSESREWNRFSGSTSALCSRVYQSRQATACRVVLSVVLALMKVSTAVGQCGPPQGVAPEPPGLLRPCRAS